MEKRKSNGFVLQAAILACAGLLTRIIGLLYGVPLTRIIGDLGNGYYSSAYNIYAIILLLSSYSIPMAVSKIISAKLVLKEYNNANRIFKCALIYVVIVGGIAALITFIFAPEIVDVEQAIPALRILAPTIFFSGLLSVFRGYIQAYDTMIPTSISQIVEQVINAVVSVAAAYFLTRPYVTATDYTLLPMHGAAGGALGTGIGVLSGLTVMLVFYGKRLKMIRSTSLTDKKPADSYRSIFKLILLMVTPVILSTCIYNISTVLDMKVFYWIMGLKEMAESEMVSLYGIFSRKYTVLVNVPIALASAVSSAMIPSISAAYEIENYEGTRDKISAALRFTMVVSIPAAVGIAVLAEPIMDLLFPGSLPIAHQLLSLGAVTIILYSISTVTNGVLQGIGKVNIPMKNAAISLGVHLVVLIPILYFTNSNLYGILFSTIVYSVSMCVLNNRAVYQYLEYKQEYRKTYMMPLVAAVVMGVVTYGSYELVYMIVPSIVVAMLISIALSVFVYFIVLMRIGGFTEEQLMMFPKGNVIIKVAKKLKLFQ